MRLETALRQQGYITPAGPIEPDDKDMAVWKHLGASVLRRAWFDALGRTDVHPTSVPLSRVIQREAQDFLATDRSEMWLDLLYLSHDKVRQCLKRHPVTNGRIKATMAIKLWWAEMEKEEQCLTLQH